MSSLKDLERMYFIVDALGNFYHLSEEGELVLSALDEEARQFTFLEANHHINSGDSGNLYSMIPVEMNKEERELARVNANNTSLDKSEETKLAKQLVEDLFDLNWLDYLKDFSYITTNISGFQKELENMLSQVDLEICDLLHYIEFYTLSEEVMIDLCKKLEEVHYRRRQIKDRLASVTSIQDLFFTKANLKNAQNGIHRLEKLQEKAYKPRVLKELFEGMPLKRIECKKEFYKEEKEMENVGQYEKEYLGMEGYEEENEYYERVETSFDQAAFDFLEFTRQQLQFYQDAETHVLNLKIDISCLEEEIEQVLECIEDANYNVAQGYKVFKRLKDMRNIIRVKKVELCAMESMIRNFDCEAMVEVYQGNLEELSDIFEQKEIEKAS